MVFETKLVIPGQSTAAQTEETSEEQEAAGEVSGGFIPEVGAQLEMDTINQHWCMKNIKRCVDKMKQLFAEDWRQKPNEMPQFAKHLLTEINDPATHPNVKIFILKIVSNDAELFAPQAKHWFEPICEFLRSKNKHGKGFHYFLRDLCTMLISWDYVPEVNASTKLLMSDVVNSLIMISADKVTRVFKQNVQILSTLIRKWRRHIAVSKLILAKMLTRPDSEADSHLWKMNAIEILALAVCNQVPVLAKTEDVQHMSQAEMKFKLQSGPKIDPLLAALLKMYESKKKPLVYATSGLVGMILQSQASEPGFPDLLKQCKAAIFANEIRERHDVFVYSIERASREFSRLLSDGQVFMKTVSFINILTGSMRAAVFQTCERFITVAKIDHNLAAIDEICMSLLAVLKDILADINDDNQ